ncbi:MAG: YesL family protein [Acholeplasmataceae bacterium]|nr:YesL family protein [Acholeplasmataceae bacterium]
MLKDLFRNLTDIIFVNLLWLLVSFLGLLITLGAATTAMFRVTFQILKKNEPTNVLSSFFKSFKEGFILSTLVWFALLAIGFPLFFMYHYAISNDLIVLLLISIVGGYQLLIFTIYFFPVAAIFKTDHWKDLIKNVTLMANTNLWTNFKVIGSLAFLVLVIVFIHESLILIAVGLYGVLVSFHLKKVFTPYLIKLGELDLDNGRNE